MSAVTPTLEQLAGNLRGFRPQQQCGDGAIAGFVQHGRGGRSKPVILGEIVRDFTQAPPR